jgi:hypothetical protein
MNETVEQKGSKPPGLVPKQVQNYVILGVATVLIAIIWLTSGNSKKPTHQGSTSGSASDFTRLNQAKLEEYKAQLAAQERLLREQQALLLGQQPPAPPGDILDGTPNSTPHSAAPTIAPQEALKTQLQIEQQKKDYQSQFANNLALSYRQELKQSSDSENFKEFLNDGKNSVEKATPSQSDANVPKQSLPVICSNYLPRASRGEQSVGTRPEASIARQSGRLQVLGQDIGFSQAPLSRLFC